MFLPCSASEMEAKSWASFSMFLQPMTMMGRLVASATAFASSTHSSTDLFAPLGSALSKCRQMAEAPGIVSAFFAMSAAVVQPS